MAVVSVGLVGLATASGDVTFTLQYDNVTMKAVSVTCVNPSSVAVTGTVTRNSDNQTFSRSFGNGTTVLNLPTSGVNSISVTLNSRGRLDGYDFAAG